MKCGNREAWSECIICNNSIFQYFSYFLDACCMGKEPWNELEGWNVGLSFLRLSIYCVSWKVQPCNRQPRFVCPIIEERKTLDVYTHSNHGFMMIQAWSISEGEGEGSWDYQNLFPMLCTQIKVSSKIEVFVSDSSGCTHISPPI